MAKVRRYGKQNVFTGTKKESCSYERPIIFQYKQYISAIVPVWWALVIISLLEFYLVLIVSKFFVLNGLFIILPFVSAWKPIFPVIMVLFNLLSSLSWDLTLPFS